MRQPALGVAIPRHVVAQKIDTKWFFTQLCHVLFFELEFKVDLSLERVLWMARLFGQKKVGRASGDSTCRRYVVVDREGMPTSAGLVTEKGDDNRGCFVSICPCEAGHSISERKLKEGWAVSVFFIESCR